MFCIFALKSVLRRFLMPNWLHFGSQWRSFGRLFASKVTILRGMVATCGVCVRYAVNMGSGWGSQGREDMEVGGNYKPRGPLATSKQIAGRPENWKTEIRTPQYARRQDRQLQNGTEWQEDKTGNASAKPCAHKGPADFERDAQYT